jgi:hypothetical protein
MNFAFICDGLLEEMWVRGGHDWERIFLRQEVDAITQEAENARYEKGNGGGGERNG